MIPPFNALATRPAKGVRHYVVRRGEQPLCWASALKLLAHNGPFQQFFNDLLAAIPFAAYRWETPALSSRLSHRQCEFVAVEAPELSVPADNQTFASYFSATEDVVRFNNLAGDAQLIVPTPQGDEQAYSHVAAFVRGAPPTQARALWSCVARTVEETLGSQPLWLSTAGGGVAWLHVRLDCRPKYYQYPPYRVTD